jgi:hypothetical protein
MVENIGTSVSVFENFEKCDLYVKKIEIINTRRPPLIHRICI